MDSTLAFFVPVAEITPLERRRVQLVERRDGKAAMLKRRRDELLSKVPCVLTMVQRWRRPVP